MHKCPQGSIYIMFISKVSHYSHGRNSCLAYSSFRVFFEFCRSGIFMPLRWPPVGFCDLIYSLPVFLKPMFQAQLRRLWTLQLSNEKTQINWGTGGAVAPHPWNLSVLGALGREVLGSVPWSCKQSHKKKSSKANSITGCDGSGARRWRLLFLKHITLIDYL